MRILLLFALVAVGVCSLAAPASADTIDQNQPSGPVYMAAFAQTDLAQSFMQTNANCSGAGILLQAGIGGTDNVTISLWTGLPNAGGTMIATASAQGTAGQWVDVYWNAVAVTPATTYYLVFTGNTSLGIAGDTNNPYPNGCVYANAGYGIFPGFDYAFRTYWSEVTPTETTTWGRVKGLYH